MSWKDKFKAAERERDGDSPKEEFKGTIYAQYKGMKWWKTFGEGFKILAKTYLPTLLIFVGLAIVFSLLSSLAMTEWSWAVTESELPVIEYLEANELIYGTDYNTWPQSVIDGYNVLYAVYQESNPNWFNHTGLFINYFFLTIGGVMTSLYIIDTAKGKKVTIFSSIKETFRADRVGVVLLTTLVVSTLTAAGFAFFFIPGLIMLIMIGLCVPVAVDSNLKFTEVMNEGFKLGKEYRLRTTILVVIAVAFFSFFGTFLATLPFPYLPQSVIKAQFVIPWYDPVTRSWIKIILFNMLNFVTTAVFMPILFAFLGVHYLETAVQKEVVWFNSTPLTKKNPSKIKPKNVLMNITPFAILVILGIALMIGFYIINPR